MRVLIVAGARPNFVKIAPLIRALDGRCKICVTHTNQHYDVEMSKSFLENLGISDWPVHHLPRDHRTSDMDIGPLHTCARVLSKIRPVFNGFHPDWCIVVGDVTSSLAAALAAKYYGVKVAHVEAGLRSRDWEMPEEINRVMIDSISDLHFCTEHGACDNLYREGHTKSVHSVGNIMIDSLLWAQKRLGVSLTAASAAETFSSYAYLTLHRPSNVDSRDSLKKIVDVVNDVAASLVDGVLFPVHPRTQASLDKFRLEFLSNVVCMRPLPYRDSLHLIENAAFVMTDSGGIQEETTYMGVPCITIRNNTERWVTVEIGTNLLVGTDPSNIYQGARSALRQRKCAIPPKWDGKTAERIADILLKEEK